MNFEKPAFEDSEEQEIKKKSPTKKRSNSLRKTFALGAAIVAGNLGSVSGASAAEMPNTSPDANTSTEQVTKTSLEKIDGIFITNFVGKIAKDAEAVALGDELDADTGYSDLVKEVTDFQTRLDFEKLSPADKKTMRDAGISINKVLEEVQIKMTEIAKDMQADAKTLAGRTDQGVVYGIDMAKARQMKINQDNDMVETFNRLSAKIDILKKKFASEAFTNNASESVK